MQQFKWAYEKRWLGEYILDANGNPVIAEDMLAWGLWMHETDRHIAIDRIGDVEVSTIFLGIDFGAAMWFADDRNPLTYQPLLWETMIFGGKHDTWQQRYRSREAALAGHKLAVEMVTP